MVHKWKIVSAERLPSHKSNGLTLLSSLLSTLTWYTNCLLSTGAWSYPVKPFLDQTWEFIPKPSLTFLPNFERLNFDIAFATGVIICQSTENAYSSRRLVLFYIGLAYVLRLRTVYSKTCHDSRLWVSNIPLYFYFTFCMYSIGLLKAWK